MALRFIDSAGQHYVNGTSGGTEYFIARKWTLNQSGVNNNGNGRRGMPFLTGAAQKTLTQQTNWITGAAFSLGAGTSAVLHYLSNNNEQVAELGLNGDATLSISCGGNNIYTSTLAVSDPSTWHFYEVIWFLNGSTNTGSLNGTLYVDGDVWGTFAGTGGNGSNYINGSFTANQVGWGVGGGCNMMDYYALDTNGTDINGNTTTNTTTLGDIQVTALLPITDVTTNWSVTGGTTTAANSAVNDFVSTSEGTFSSPDDDTSYIYSSSTTSAEVFNYQSISTFTGTIFGAQYLLCAKKTAEGSREIILTLNGTPVKTSNFIGTSNYLSDYYVYYMAPLDSINGTPWTVSGYDSADFGVTLSG